MTGLRFPRSCHRTDNTEKATHMSPPKGSTVVSDPTEAFFADLARGDRDPRLSRLTGSIRFDLMSGADTEHWRVDIEDGRFAVSRAVEPADAVLTLDRTLFEAFTTGRANAWAAILRGAVGVEGDLHLLMMFQSRFATFAAGRTGQEGVDR